MPSAEFTEWKAYAALEPFGEARADLRSGIVAATLANIHRAKKTKAFKPHDFMPFQEEDSLPQDEGDAIEALFVDMGLRVVEKKNHDQI
jgi:hypothetical protein